MTPLHGAAYYGHPPVVALLLATPGVDPLDTAGVGVTGHAGGMPSALFCHVPSLSAAGRHHTAESCAPLQERGECRHSRPA